MATNNKEAAAVVVNRLTSMVAGFQKDFTAKQSLTVDGTSMLQPAILSQLAADLALLTDAENARNALAVAVAAKKAGAAGTTLFLSQLEKALETAFGSGNPQLQDFGIAPPKTKKQLTVEQKALSVAAAKGTKKVRGIIGKNQRAQITTQGKPGLAVVDPQGNVVPGALTGPTPPGSGTPVTVNPAAVGSGNGPTSGGSTPPAGSAQ
jgi:hypothetical protein